MTNTNPLSARRHQFGAIITPQSFGAIGNGVADDTAAWNTFQAATGMKAVPAGQYLVDGAIRRFDKGCFGNGDFMDANAAWDQATGDRERHAIIVHRNEIDANSSNVSPVIKTQTHIDFARDIPSGSFKHVIGAYHEATYDGYYNTQADTNQNFTVMGASVLNRMAGLFGGLALTLQAEDANETVNPNIPTMGASKNGCAFLRYTRNAKFEYGGYGFGLEVYCQNAANETLDVPYQNSDDFFSIGWTAGIKVAVSASGAPISAAMFTHGLTGKHGAWNGIVIGGSGFKINNDGQGVAGTVGLNFASHRSSSGYADIAIKFRTNNRHLHFREGAKIRSSHTRFMYEAGDCGVSIEGTTGSNQFLNFRRGADGTPDGGTVINNAQFLSSPSQLVFSAPAGELIFSPVGVASWRINSARFAPVTTNAFDIGSGTLRVKDYYGVNSPNISSDERVKTDIKPIDDAALDAWADVEYAQYRMKDAAEEKSARGEVARLHTGVIAQRVLAAFEARGLDAAAYGLLCHDVWDGAPEHVEEFKVETKPAVYEQKLVKEAVFKKQREKILVSEAVHEKVMNDDGSFYTVEVQPAVYREGEEELVQVEDAKYEDGDLISPAEYETTRVVIPAKEAGDRYGIRYEEALCIEAAYQRRRADRMEAEISAIKKHLGI